MLKLRNTWDSIWIPDSRGGNTSQKKRKQIDLKIKELYWLIRRKSKLSLQKEILLYKTIIVPIWTYDIELWGCASKSSIAIKKPIQNSALANQCTLVCIKSDATQ